MQGKYTNPDESAPTHEEYPRIDKVIRIQNFHTKTVHDFKVKVEYIPSSREINISSGLQQVHSQGLKIENSQIFFQNPELKILSFLGTFPFQVSTYLKYQYCVENIIKIRYKKLNDSPKSVQSQKEKNSILSSSSQSSYLPPKQKNQRTINEVFQVVQKWKKLQVDDKGNKIRTLSEAADVIGVCKKTLEDYAHQIQFAKDFDFNFESNGHQKIGFLRSFVKSKKKQLAIFNNIDNYLSFDNSNSDQDSKSGV